MKNLGVTSQAKHKSCLVSHTREVQNELTYFFVNSDSAKNMLEGSNSENEVHMKNE
jgi:hypothetical protein